MQTRWRGKVRELTAAALALTATLALMLWGAAPASAGGPTSVLIVSPQSQETSALYYTHREYGELESLLGEPKGGDTEPRGADSLRTRLINVTWMTHDISPHRFDQIYLIPETEDIWIHTVSDPLSSEGVWHRADSPGRLRALLEQLGVLGKVSDEGLSAGFPAPADTAPDAAAEAPATEAGTEPNRESGMASAATVTSDTEWGWAIPGLAAGAVLALVLRPLALRLPAVASATRMRRTRKGDGGGPRQELRDV
ncbi:hypothetical protein [Streptomyces sp. NPDC088789]|uniref:hypothetical protein n=1 Tax=Streptomyces sp. NPDC088789 TaxID=3365899 RepID=UPI0037F426A6